MAGLTGRALGLVLIFLTAIIWVAASFVSQLLVTNEEGRTNFNVPPFLLTYLSTSVFTVFLPLVQLKSLLQETWLLRRSFKYKPLQDDEESAHLTGPTDTSAHTAAAAAEHSSDSSSPACRAGGGGGGLTADLEVAEAAAAAEAASAAVRASRAAHKEALTAAAQCFLLWFVAQFLFNQSLKLTSVTSNTILSSTSSLFTFALSMVFLREPYTVAKLLSIAACIGGTLLVTLSDDSSGSSSNVRGSSLAASIAAGSNATAALPAAATPGNSGGSSEPSHSVWGDMLCLVSAAFYACYTIVLRKALPDDDEANVALFFGYVGLLCSVVFAPVVAVLAGVGALHIKAIPSKAYLIILVQGVLNYCLSDYLWAHAVLLLGPTIATLGLSVQIPVAAVVEAIIGHPKWLSTGASIAMTLSGTGLIMLGFVAGNLAGGGHVYGSHHRDGQLEECSSPGALADDSFTDHRQSPAPARAVLNGSSHNHNGCAHPQRGSSDSGSDGDDLPQSPLLNQAKARQQGSAAAEGFTMPVSTHARVIAMDNDGSPRSSSPGRPPGGPPLSGDVAAAVTCGDGSSPAGSSGGRSPRKAALGARQLLPLSRQQLQQEAEQQGSSHERPASRPSQQWESIELSSSFGSDNKSEQRTPTEVSALRPREQLLPRQSPLGLGQNSSMKSDAAMETAGPGAGCIPPAAADADVG